MVEIGRDQLGRVVPTGVRFSAIAQSDPTGGYSIAGLPAGQYDVCAEPAGKGYLGSCEWMPASPPTSVAEGAISAMAPLILRKGTIVQLAADDLGNLIVPVSGIATIRGGRYFFPSVETAAGYFSSFQRAGQSGNQHIFTVTIPKTATVELFLDTDLLVTTSSGSTVPVDARSGIAVTGGPDTVMVEVSVQGAPAAHAM
jgi:hypothetical protein